MEKGWGPIAKLLPLVYKPPKLKNLYPMTSSGATTWDLEWCHQRPRVVLGLDCREDLGLLERLVATFKVPFF